MNLDPSLLRLCWLLEIYRLELAKKSLIDLQLNLNLPWFSIFWIHEIVLISKSFWFIKRLVEEDKIDLKEFHRLCWIINQDSEYWNWTPQEYEQVIMYLSISDSPMEDLVSLLK